jgi:hypothetical protein
VGSFTATDPMDVFWNTYSYTGCNPINLIDPDGQDVLPDDGSFVGPPAPGDVWASDVGLPSNTYIYMTGRYFGDKIEIFAPKYSQYEVTDWGVDEMKEYTGYANNVAWVFPPAKIPVTAINVGFTVGDWAMKWHETGSAPWSTILTDAASYGIGKIGLVYAKETIGRVGAEIVSNTTSRAWDESSKAIENAGKKRH